MTIAFVIIYLIGAAITAILSFFVTCLGGRPLTFSETMGFLGLILFWPVAVPYMLSKAFFR